jgi:hypothetical protein
LIETKDGAWPLSILDSSNLKKCVNELRDDQTMSSWSAFNSVITEETLPQTIVGFILVFPHPVTEYAAVYTSLKNFQDVLSQLNQCHNAINCRARS